jgi:hypothetical protein
MTLDKFYATDDRRRGCDKLVLGMEWSDGSWFGTLVLLWSAARLLSGATVAARTRVRPVLGGDGLVSKRLCRARQRRVQSTQERNVTSVPSGLFLR